MRLSRSCTTYARATAVALLGVLLGIGAVPASAADDAPWTVGTAANDFGSNRPNYTYALDPGGQLADGLVINNPGTAPLKLAVYAADAFTTDAGQVDLVTKDARSTGIGAWVRPAQSEVIVPPGKSASVPFTLDLPADAAPGDYLGGIVTSLTQKGTGDGGVVDRRLGLRIRLRVGGDLKPRLAVENLQLHYPGNPFSKGDATVTYTIHNTGNAILTARQTAAVSSPFGWLQVAAEQLADSPQLLPGGTWKVTAKVKGVAPAFRPTTTVTLIPLLTDAAGSTAPLAKTTTRAWTIPWVPLAVLLLLCLLAAIITTRRRKNHAPAA
jgi:hypothetical protein